MAVNKVIYGDSTLIDITDSTVTASDVASGKTFHLADGSLAEGTLQDGNFLSYGITDGTLPWVGVAKIGSAVLFETSPQVGTAQAGYTTLG